MGKEMELKVAVVGCGAVANDIHLPSWQKVKGAEVVMVVDIIETRAKETAAKWKIAQWNTNYQKVLDNDEINIVNLCLPHNLHYEHVCRAAEAKKHIMLEKPISNTAEEAETMVFAARKNKVKFMIEEQWRFAPQHLQAQEDIRDGYIGKVFMARSENLSYSRAIYNPPPWAQKIETAGTGTLGGFSCHNISFLRMLFGEVESIYAAKGSGIEHKLLDPEIELYVMAILKFKNGILGEIVGSLTTREYTRFHSWIYGDKGTIYMDIAGEGKYELYSVMKPKPSERRNLLSQRKGAKLDDVSGEFQYFVDCIREDKEPKSASGEDEKKTFDVCLAGYESMKEGREIKISEFNSL